MQAGLGVPEWSHSGQQTYQRNLDSYHTQSRNGDGFSLGRQTCEHNNFAAWKHECVWNLIIHDSDGPLKVFYVLLIAAAVLFANCIDYSVGNFGDERIVATALVQNFPSSLVPADLLLIGHVAHEQFQANRKEHSVPAVCEGDCLFQQRDLKGSQSSPGSSTCAQHRDEDSCSC